MTVRHYASPEAFRQALEQRLKDHARATGADMNRRRQVLVFERFLVRACEVFGEDIVLKGGFGLELRLAHARTTRDVDLGVRGFSGSLLDRLRKAGELDLGEPLRFTVVEDPRQPDILNEGARYEGKRFRVEARIAGRRYGQPFGVDVAVGDPVVGTPGTLQTSGLLSFVGIEPVAVSVLPVETHVAEKLHAYTMPRSRPNSRVKDLPDLALLATVGALHESVLRRALHTTFGFRGSHDLPECIPDPPLEWGAVYRRMARADSLPWESIDVLLGAVRRFLEPVLVAETLERLWEPAEWDWLPGV